MTSEQYYNTKKGKKVMERNLKLLDEFKLGATKYSLAKRYKLSATRIRQIINSLERKKL
jgi:Mor family transcriptional regulator